MIENEEQAQAMLKELRAFYKQPVMPISKYCDALRTWQRCMYDRAIDLRAELFPGIHGDDGPLREKAWNDSNLAMKNRIEESNYAVQDLHRFETVAESINFVAIQISKSALLDRLLYVGEPLRTKKCPTHKGTWSGLFGDCEHGCELTGWLPTEEDK